MFVNFKAQKLYDQNQQVNCEQLQIVDSKIMALHGNSYQQSLYTDFQEDNGVCFIPFGFDNQFCPIYGIYGYRIEQDNLNFVRVHLVKTILEEIIDKKQSQRGISIVYFSNAEIKAKNSRKEKKRKLKQIDFATFKNHVIKNLQIKYLKCIKCVYVCHEGLFAKSISSLPFNKFGVHNLIVQHMIRYCDKLENLVKCLGPLFQCELIKQQVQEYNGTVHWLDMYSEKDKKLSKRKMIELLGEQEDKNKFYRLKLEDYNCQLQTGIPIVLNSLLTCLQNNTKYLKSEGIFRKAAHHQKLLQLQNQLVGCCQQQQIHRIAQKHDADTIACCIKSIFNKLNPPIISYQFYNQIVLKMDAMYTEVQNQNKLKNKNKIFKVNSTIDNQENKLLGRMEKQNKKLMRKEQANCQCKLIQNPSKLDLQVYHEKTQQLLAYIAQRIGEKQRAIILRMLNFFKDSIMTHQKWNKMGAYNLSVVMAPCIFRPRKYSIQDLINSPRLVNLLFYLILDPTKIQ